MRKYFKEQTAGEWFIFMEVILFAFSPVFISYNTRLMPPILFAGLSIFIASIPCFFYLLYKGKLAEIFNKKVFISMLMIVIFIMVLPNIFIYLAGPFTSAINISILLNMEILTTFLICGLFFGEPISRSRILGAFVIGVGAVSVLYNGDLNFKIADLLIIVATVFYPIGNIFAKKILNEVLPLTIIFVRNVLGGISLIIISLLFEKYDFSLGGYFLENFWMIFLNGIIVYFISKIFWYEALKRMDVTKTTLLANTTPAFTLIYAGLLLGEKPTIYQIIGFMMIFVGFYITIRNRKTLIHL